MSKISAKIVCDSLSPQGERLTTYILTYPRFIHAEVMTHRVFSRNTASSRAIPFKRMVEMVENDPFIPIAWQKDHSGMQGNEYITEGRKYENSRYDWLKARSLAVQQAKLLNESDGVTKQLCNRLLEPFLWHTALVTASEWDNFFELRCPKYKFGNKTYWSKRDWYNDPILTSNDGFDGDAFPHEDDMWWYSINESGAEIHIQALAEAMWDAYNESKPQQLQAGEYHIPFGDKIDKANLINYIESNYTNLPEDSMIFRDLKLKIAVARCARLSYMTFDNEINYRKDIELHDMLLKSKHASPFEHVARAMTDKEYNLFIKGKNKEDESQNLKSIYGWCNNIKGFVQYRYLIENEG